jgi:HPt (histidine-containing phosphotransfer) domain-containing protein
MDCPMQDEQTGKPEGGRSAELQSQMARIGDRFLDRVLADFDAMNKALAALGSGEPAAATALEMFAHRVHGSSAIFGFVALSEAAGALEMLLVSEQAQANPVASLPAITQCMAAVHAAAQAARAGSA